MSINIKKINRLIQSIDFSPYTLVVDSYKRSNNDYRIQVRLFRINYLIGEIQHIKADLMILDNHVYGLFSISSKTKPMFSWHNVQFRNEKKLVYDIEQTLQLCIEQLN